MKPPRTFGVAPTTTESMLKYAQELIAKTLSNISFGTTTSNADADMNMQVFKATGTSPGGANTTFVVSHTLKHVPIGFSVIRTNVAAHLYDAGVAWTAATNGSLGTISLKADQPSVAFVIIIY